MKIGILETGRLPETLSHAYGDYPRMFEDLLRSADPAIDFAVYPVVDERLPADVRECDAWLVTGSRHGVYDPLPWIEPLKRFLKNAYDGDVPIVGICFGHQILAEALGGQARKSERGWGLGVHRYRVSRKPEWMTGIDDELVLNALHQDQVTQLPPDAEVLAGSQFCPYAVLGYRGSAMSIQPHPEFLTDFFRDLIAARSGESFSAAEADTALATLDAPLHTGQVAQWIVRFLREQLAANRKSA